MFELLFENGNFSANEQYANLNFRKISFFQYAVFIEKEQIVSYLLSQKGIDVNQFLDIKKSKKETISKAPLHFAIEKANVGIASLLLNDPNIDVNAELDDTLEFEIHYKLDQGEHVIKTGYIHIITGPLLMAVKNDCNEIIELLLNNPDIEVNYKKFLIVKVNIIPLIMILFIVMMEVKRIMFYYQL